MRSAYRALALLVCLGVVVQVVSIAVDQVLLRESGSAAARTAHEVIGMLVVPVLALLLLVVSFFAKVPGGVPRAAVILLLVLAQVGLGAVFFDATLLGVLHGVNAFLVLGVALVAARRAGAVAESPA